MINKEDEGKKEKVFNRKNWLIHNGKQLGSHKVAILSNDIVVDDGWGVNCQTPWSYLRRGFIRTT